MHGSRYVQNKVTDTKQISKHFKNWTTVVRNGIVLIEPKGFGIWRSHVTESGFQNDDQLKRYAKTLA